MAMMRSLSPILPAKAHPVPVPDYQVDCYEIQSQSQSQSPTRQRQSRNLGNLDNFQDSEPVEGKNEKEKDVGNLYQSFRWFLLFGKFIGLVPIQGLFQTTAASLKFKKWSFASLMNILVCILLSASGFVGLVGMGKYMAGKSPGHFAYVPASFSFYAQGVFVYAYFVQKGGKLTQLFMKWENLSSKLEMTKPDVSLSRDVNLIAGILLTSALAENAISHVKLFQLDSHQLEHSSSESDSGSGFHVHLGFFEGISKSFEFYYYRGQTAWTSLVPYNFPLAFALFLGNKFAVLSWNYCDLLVIVFSRALYFKFKSLVTEGRSILFKRKGKIQNDGKWRQLLEEYEILCKMLAEVNSFLSPLVFLSFALNVYFVCIQIHLGVIKLTGRMKWRSASTTRIESVYAVWSFIHLIVRIFLVSLSGSRVNEWGCKISEVLKKCPNQLYTSQVKRTESFARTSAFGVTGLEAFHVKKSLILKIVGIVFTFVVFLLQTKY